MHKLEGKVALITGGSSGIGLASARLFRAEGASIVLTGRDPQALAQAAAELGGDTLALASDAADLAQIDALMAAVQARHGRLDVLFLNAGVATAGPIETVTPAQFDSMMDTNVKGVFFTIQKALPLMGKGASIVVTTSITNQLGSPNFPVYGASKAALRSLVKSLGLALIGRGIRINALSPGPIATPIFDRFGLPPGGADAARAAITAKSPSQRFGEPEEVARLALFLASSDASYLVGEEVVIDGGMSLL
ncbi:SDR family oxidoreductase [Massilia sp. TS11]|uniref:SDR family oxidoreductase n=1 Tax=Massilia sp. TS11 TaxID=2908003 RepID=UPI001EDB53C0|nr:SDR family oxidoreductase [Massilia sp. TS11]MCG2583302.1 SDR family oxidoreductase [Massilia sp. TS11]